MRRVFLLTVLFALLAPAGAFAQYSNPIHRDCGRDGRVDGRYTQSEYETALRRIPSDLNEYTECRRIIQEARRRDANLPGGTSGGGGTPGGGVAGGFNGTSPPPAANAPPTPAESSLVEQAAGGAGGAPVAVAGEPITPGGSGLVEAAFRHSLPAPLLVVVILLGLGALAAILSGARGRGMHAPGAVLRVFDRVFPRRA